MALATLRIALFFDSLFCPIVILALVHSIVWSASTITEFPLIIVVILRLNFFAGGTVVVAVHIRRIAPANRIGIGDACR
jgi:hypothetical protein